MARHALMVEHAMRPLLSYLHAVVVPTALFVAADDWGGIRGAGDQSGPEALARRLDRAVAELKLLAQLGMAAEVVEPAAPTAERKPGDGLAFARTKVDDLDTVVPFEVLLRSV